MEKMREMVFIKGKEAIVVNILLFFALLLFIVPIVLILFLRFLYRSIQTFKEQTILQVPINGILEKV